MPQQLMKPRPNAYRRARASVYAFEFDSAGFKSDLYNMVNGLRDGGIGATAHLGSARITGSIGVPIEIGAPVAHDYGDSSRIKVGLGQTKIEIVVAPLDTTRTSPSSLSGPSPYPPSYLVP
ncbi:MAG: hypothetical protein WDA75_00190 [Candidatus Latescibacterota bacterium]|jgi:hypothetical protein